MKKFWMMFLLLALALSLTACAGDSARFSGSLTTDDLAFSSQFIELSDTLTSTLKLEDGDVIRVEIVCESGELDATIGIEGAQPVYEGKQLQTGAFSVTVHEAGTYTVAVAGRKAKGSFAFAANAD